MDTDAEDENSGVAVTVLPITAVVLLLCVTVAPLEPGTMVMFLFGALLLVLGMGLFTLGVDLSMMPMGEGIGIEMSKSLQDRPAADGVLRAGRADHHRRAGSAIAGAAGAVHSQPGADSVGGGGRGAVSGRVVSAHSVLRQALPRAAFLLRADLPSGVSHAEGVHSHVL